jgi:hypothetical protein
MPDLIEAVNELALSFRSAAARSDIPEPVAKLWAGRAETVEAAAVEIQRLRGMLKPVPAGYGDISDLPPELVAQLAGAKTDELEEQIFAIVKAAGEQIELDRLLIELYRRHQHVFERRFLNNKCYRMAQKGLIHIVPGRKGVYTTQPIVGADSPPEETGGGFQRASKATFTADLDDEIPF